MGRRQTQPGYGALVLSVYVLRSCEIDGRCLKMSWMWAESQAVLQEDSPLVGLQRGWGWVGEWESIASPVFDSQSG